MQPIRFSEPGAFYASGDLWTRIQRNFTRLEETRWMPENVFQRERAAEKWPGDIEGRTLLAWILLEKATGRPARYLDAVLDRWPGELNEAGYFGRLYGQMISEQQLSGHGWVLRALSLLSELRADTRAEQFSQPIIDQLFLPVAGEFSRYPIDAESREAAGSFSGSHLRTVGRWVLSTDVGCFAIGMAGLIDAWSAFRRNDSRVTELVEEMIGRFLEIDLRAIGAQTHATLSGCRGLLVYAEATSRMDLVEAVAERFDLYLGHAQTETHANFNWFGRPQWTEPCAVVDSIMVAAELWRRTGATRYLEFASLAYFNGLGHALRMNGGFGCDNCVGADGSSDLSFQTVESHWCCTMRGGEGLARVAQYQVAFEGDTVRLPFGLPGDYQAGVHDFSVETRYPDDAAWRIHNRADAPVRVSLYLPSWITSEKGSAEWVDVDLAAGETAEINGTLQTGNRPLLPATQGQAPTLSGSVRFRGPLLLAGAEAEPSAIFYDYHRGDISKERSAKQLIV